MSTKYATLETTRGTIVAELFDRDCPATVENFQRLANAGFYDGVKFHRVLRGVMAQTGDPLSREHSLDDPRVGSGGPGYTISSETVGNRRRHIRGAIAMAHDGEATSGSQFFFVVGDENARRWNGVHTVFGQTLDGLDILAAIEPGDVIVRVRAWE